MHSKIRFGDYQFDLETGDLTREGIRLRLEAQPARVLRMLVEKRGGLVTRGELVAALWPGEIAGNFDRRLDKAIAKLRAALNDDPAEPRFIETLKGRGYRFLEKVETQSFHGPPAPLLPEKAVEAPPIVAGPAPAAVARPHGRAWWQRLRGQLLRSKLRVAAMLGMFAVAIGSLWMKGSSKPSTAASHIHPAVVLLLGVEDTSDSDQDRWVARSVGGWLATDLNSESDVEVVQMSDGHGPLSPANLKTCGAPGDAFVHWVQNSYRADYVVYGGYESSSSQEGSASFWRLQLCVLNTRNPSHPDVLNLTGNHDQIAELVTDAGMLLRTRMNLKPRSPQSLQYLRAALPANLGAARLFAEGTLALERFDPQEAVALLTQAEQLEPSHVATHAALADAWARLGYQERSRSEANQARNLSRALSPRAQAEFAGLAAEADEDWPAAAASYRILLRLQPGSIPYTVRLAKAMTRAGKAQEALRVLSDLQANNPLASADPRVDLAEARAYAAVSDFRHQLEAATLAETNAHSRSIDLLVADARMEEGSAEDALGNGSEALRFWQLAGEAYASIGDLSGSARALNREGLLSLQRDNLAQASDLFTRALKLSRTSGDQEGLAFSLSELGIVRMQLAKTPAGDAGDARRMFHEAADIYKTTGNTAEEGYVTSLLGDEAMQRRQFEEGRGWYERALALSQAAHDQSRVAGRLMDLGIVAQSEGRLADSEQYFKRAALEFEAIAQPDRVAMAHTRLAITAYQRGDLDRAASILTDAIATLRKIGRIHQVCEATGDLARVEIVRNPARAESLARDVLNNCGNRKEFHGGGELLARLAQAEAEEGDVATAKTNLDRAFRGDGISPLEFNCDALLAQGFVRGEYGDFAGARSSFMRLGRLADQGHMAYWKLESRLGLAEIHYLENSKRNKPAWNQLESEATRDGYGVIPLQIDVFLRSARTRSGVRETNSGVASLH